MTMSSENTCSSNELPKWRLKANWILRQYARIWLGIDSPNTINFNDAFEDVFFQFFLDEGLLEQDAKGCIRFAEYAYEEHCSLNEDGLGERFFTSAERWKWIVEKGMFSFLKDKFLEDGTISQILYIADYTEKANILPLKDYTGPWIDYEYCLALPCLPPLGHEWVDDPWERLGK
jgi:hypothetical protein